MNSINNLFSKNNELRERIYSYAIVGTIGLLLVAALVNIALAYPFDVPMREGFSTFGRRWFGFRPAAYGMLHLVSGVMLLLLSRGLYRRLRIAWMTTVGVLMLSLTLSMFHVTSFSRPLIWIEFFALCVLVWTRFEFQRETDALSLKRALRIAGVLLIFAVGTLVVGFFILKNEYGAAKISEAFSSSAKLLIFMDNKAFGAQKAQALIFARTAIVFAWVCIVGSFFLVLKPLVYTPLASKHNKVLVATFVRKFGKNPLAYLALEPDKTYFFSTQVEGVIAFTIVGDVALCCGDPICSKEDGGVFLCEFLAFSKRNNYSAVFVSTTHEFFSVYKALGFEYVKYGEDACFKLEEYNLKGNKIAKVRAAINRANKDGMTVHEYDVRNCRNVELEAEILQLSKEWQAAKTGSDIKFMIGGINLREPLGRRYFYARDADGKLVGFLVCLPYDNGKSYLIDLSKRHPQAPQGTLEKLTYDSFMMLKDDGAQWANLGLVPLLNVREDSESKITAHLFAYIYENLNSVYGFKTLHHAKLKYAPTEWQSRYIMYHPKRFTPQIAFALIKAQNPEILSLLKTFAGPKK